MTHGLHAHGPRQVIGRKLAAGNANGTAPSEAMPAQTRLHREEAFLREAIPLLPGKSSAYSRSRSPPGFGKGNAHAVALHHPPNARRHRPQHVSQFEVRNHAVGHIQKKLQSLLGLAARPGS